MSQGLVQWSSLDLGATGSKEMLSASKLHDIDVHQNWYLLIFRQET